jgi:hypothetical protein
MSTAPERKTILSTLEDNHQLVLPSTSSVIGLDLTTGKQLYYNTSTHSWANQETVTASYGVFSQLTGSLSGTVTGNPFIVAGSSVTANYNSLGQWEITGSGASFSSQTPQTVNISGTAGSAGVSSDAARADHSHAVDTSLKSLDSATWTAVGTGTATFTSGTGSLTLTPAQTSVGMTSPITFCSPFFPAVEYIAQITRTATPTGVAHRQNIGLNNSAVSLGFLLQIDSGNLISCFYANTANSWQFFASAGAITPWNDGLLWLRIILTPAYVSMYQGSGATTPTSWTFIGRRDISGGLLGAIDGNTTHFQFGISKDAGGTGNFTCTVDNVQCRSLLGAPT